MYGCSTGIINSRIWDCDNVDQLKTEIIPLLKNQRMIWVEKIQQILEEKHLTCKELARLCRVSEAAVRKWRKGAIPQSRDMFIRIGFAADYSLTEMNNFLQRYGKYPQLYAKSLEDSACIFVLLSETLSHTYETYLLVLETIKAEMRNDSNTKQLEYTTDHLFACVDNMTSLEEMVEFAKTNSASFKQVYSKFYSYIIAFLQINLQSEHFGGPDQRSSSFHAMATESHWSSSLRHCVSEIRNKRWFPLRHKVISLCLHLNMDTDAINRALLYAQMEPLYVKNPIEAAVVWAIDEVKLSSIEDAIIQDGSSDLCEYVRDILVQLELSDEDSNFFNDLY